MSAGIYPALALSLALTLIFETAFALVAGKRRKKDLLLIVLANILTNPAVVLLYWLAVYRTGINDILIKAVLEISAVFIEGFIYGKYGSDFKHPYIFSAAANTLSFTLGAVIQIFI